MKAALLAAVLLIGVFMADCSWRWLGAGTKYGTYGLWYILQNLWVLILCVTNVIFLSEMKRTLCRDMAILACGIGAVQGLKDAWARALVEDKNLIPKGVDVGDFVTGFPLQAVLVALYLLTAIAIYHAHSKQRTT